MPLTQKVSYSKPVLVKNPDNGQINLTLGLFNKKHELIELRACEYKPEENKFKCPRQSSQPKQKAKLQKKLGINKLNKELYKK